MMPTEAGPFEFSTEDFNYIARLVQESNDYSSVVECGVYRGGSISRMRLAFDPSYSINGFDSFEGLPEDWKGAPSHCRKGCFSTDGVIPTVEGVTFFKGWFDTTLPVFVKDYPDPLAFLFVDCDLFNSTMHVLNILNPLICPGTVIAFDEYYYNADPRCDDHEKAALDLWVAEKHHRVRQQPFANGQMILRQEKALFVVEE